MDNTELHYIDYDPETTWDNAMRAYIEAGGDILYPGDEKEMLLRGALAMATAIMAKIDSGLRMATRTYAVGDYLKEYGKDRGCIYIEAVAATVRVQMIFADSGRTQTIRAGMEWTADGSMIYATVEDIRLTGYAQEIETTLRCMQAGSAGNGLKRGTELQCVKGIAGLVQCLTLTDAVGGVDAEEQEAYRARIGSFGLNSTTSGTKSQYESAAMAASAQVLDASAINDGGGEVGIYMILTEGSDEGSVFTLVENALNAKEKRTLTDHVQTHSARKRAYSMQVKVWYSQYEGVGDKVSQAVQDFKAWQNKRIGRHFNPDKLISMLYQAGCERVQVMEGSGMEGAEKAEYTEIDEREYCDGTISLTVVNT